VRVKAPFRLPRPAVDALTGLGFLAAAVLAIQIARSVGWYPYDPDSYVGVALLTAFALTFGRAYPGLTLAMVLIAVIWPTWWFDVPELRLLPLLVAGYQATANGIRLRVVVPAVVAGAVGGLLPGLAVMALASRDLPSSLTMFADPSRRILTGVLVLAAVLVGAFVARQRRGAQELRRRNEELLRLRQVERERIAADERATIARDIHDVVAHHISAMVIRAQAADRVADQRPEELRSVVRGIATDGREALTAMRQVVRVLRQGESGNGTSPSLSGALEDAASRVRDAGIAVSTELQIGGPLTEFEQAAVLRIIQEAMANVLLHSSATEVSLGVRVDDQATRLEVSDNGAPRELMPGTPASGGNGLRGMRERAMSLGGTLTAAPRSEGGWSVTAVIPRSGQEDDG
jgi:signal transduction histidine kinase